MAARKKTSKSTKKKPSAASRTSTKKRARSTKQPIVLTVEDRQRVMKPREGWEDVLERSLDAWKAAPKLKVPGLTLSKLSSLGAKAQKAAEKERELVAKQQRQLRPLSDARLVQQGEVWRSILELNAAVKYHARHDPALLDQFAFLTDALSNERGTQDPSES